MISSFFLLFLQCADISIKDMKPGSPGALRKILSLKPLSNTEVSEILPYFQANK